MEKKEKGHGCPNGLTCRGDTAMGLQAGTLTLEGRRCPLPPPGSSSGLPSPVAVYRDRLPERADGWAGSRANP